MPRRKKSALQSRHSADLIENTDLVAESCECAVLLHGDKPIGVELPNFVVHEIAETDPPEKGGRLNPRLRFGLFDHPRRFQPDR